jgi:drug/metabolite transporter (DMT)-like permease
MEALAGGAALWMVGLAGGERIHAAAITLRSVLSLGYLVVFGSIIGFSAYVWLLKVASPERVSTYAFVNPIVAVALGLAFGGEILTPRIAAAAAVIVGAVGLILKFGKTREELPQKTEAPRQSATR